MTHHNHNNVKEMWLFLNQFRKQGPRSNLERVWLQIDLHWWFFFVGGDKVKKIISCPFSSYARHPGFLFIAQNAQGPACFAWPSSKKPRYQLHLECWFAQLIHIVTNLLSSRPHHPQLVACLGAISSGWGFRPTLISADGWFRVTLTMPLQPTGNVFWVKKKIYSRDSSLNKLFGAFWMPWSFPVALRKRAFELWKEHWKFWWSISFIPWTGL